MAPKLQRCSHCHASAGVEGGKDKGIMQLCGGCAGFGDWDYAYCNKECQKAAWKGHKDVCRQRNRNFNYLHSLALSANNPQLAVVNQMRKFTTEYTPSFAYGMMDALGIHSMGPDLTSSHIVHVKMDWCGNDTNPIEKQFKLRTIDVRTNAEHDVMAADHDMSTSAELGKMAARTRQSRGWAGPTPNADWDAPDHSKMIVYAIIIIYESRVDGTLVPGQYMTQGHDYPRAPPHGFKRLVNPKWKEYLFEDVVRPPLKPAAAHALAIERYETLLSTKATESFTSLRDQLNASVAGVTLADYLGKQNAKCTSPVAPFDYDRI